MTPLRIAQVAPLWTPVPPATYGGTERMVHLLTEELVRRGHAVTLFASGDSRTSATLRSVCEINLSDAMARGEAYEYAGYAASALAEALRDPDAFDVIHCHLGCFSLPFGELSKTPVLHTIVTPPTRDDRWLFDRYPHAPLVARSQFQVAALSGERRANVHVIYNGLDFDTYALSSGPGRHLAFLGRMGPQKSPADAIRIASQAGWPLVMAGMPQNAGEQVYFAEQVRPHIDGTRVRYIGGADHQQKQELLREAAALLFPIQGEEAFGIAMVEAMACGVPVLACARGSISEVIDPGVTGFYADTPQELAALVPRAVALDRRAVRDQAMRRFSHHRMVDDYVALYTALAAQRRTRV